MTQDGAFKRSSGSEAIWQGEAVLQAFENAWQSGQPPRIEDFLRDRPTNGLALLAELVHTDLEYRLKAKQIVSVDDYIARFPQLQARGTFVAELREAAERLRAAPNQGALPSQDLPLAGHTPSTADSTQTPNVMPADLETTASFLVDAQPSDPTAVTFLSPPTHPGDLGLLGHYRILKEIGHGGMGAVYHAFDTTIDRDVAIKVILSDSWSLDAEQRFEREAKAIAKIDHDHVVRIHQFGRIGKMLFLEMPLLRGQALGTRLSRDKQLPIADAIKIGLEMAEGLAAAHAAGLVHRDIKPANVFLSEESGSWRVRILDLGLARQTDAKLQLTAAGFIVGTPAYMSPEQAEGKSVDARSDLFSLGVVLYHVLTGANPFSADSFPATVLKIVSEQPPPVGQVRSDVPVELSKVIEELMAKDANHRPASAKVVAERLRQLAKDSATHATVAFPQARPQLPSTVGPGRRSRVRTALAKFSASFGFSKIRVSIGITITVTFGILAAVVLLGRSGSWLPNAENRSASDAVDVAARMPPKDAQSADFKLLSKAAPAKLGLELNLFAIKKGNDRDFNLNEPNVLPLKAGDALGITAKTARPAYFYVLNLTADGKVYPMYPWRGSDWDKLDEEKARTEFKIPDPRKTDDDAAVLGPGPSGFEAIVVLARETPLTKAERDRLREHLRSWPANQGKFDPLRAAVTIGEDEFRFADPRDEKARGPLSLNETVALKDPVFRLRRLLQTDIRDLGVASRGVCYTFQGDGKK